MRLQEQGNRLMAADYAGRNQGAEFPLGRLAEEVYAMRLADRKALAGDAFRDEIAAMERHKMLLRRVETGPDRKSAEEWRFRHDKVMRSSFSIMHSRARIVRMGWRSICRTRAFAGCIC